MAEGSIWEALDNAAYYRLANLTAIVDVNRLGQRGPTELGWDIDTYARRVEAFGCRALVIDGHDLEAIDRALAESRSDGDGRPTVILARTIKGKGVPEVEDKEGWHGKAFPADLAEGAIGALGGDATCTVRRTRPGAWPPAIRPPPRRSPCRPTRWAPRWPPARPTGTR